MLRTRAGYAGGEAPSPTYRNMGDHTEVIQVDFDPGRITYGALLEEFWREHRPVRAAWKRQYRSVILCSDATQLRLASASIEAAEARLGQPLHMAVELLRLFTAAEDHHQKYYLRHDPTLFLAVKQLSADELMNSTLAARLNAQAAGYSAVKLAPEIAELSR